MNSKELKVGAILSYVYIFISFGVTILFTPFLIKYLGDSQYGLYNLAIAFMGYLEVLNVGMSSTYIKFAANLKDKKELAILNGQIFKIYMFFGIIASICGVVAIVFIEDFFKSLTLAEIGTLRILLYMMVFNVIVSSINGIFDSNIVLNEKFTFQKTISIIKKLFLPVISIPCLLLGLDVLAVGLIYVLANVFSLIINMYYCYKNKQLEFIFEKSNRERLRKIIKFYFFVFLTIIVDQINWSIDSFIIGRLKGSFEVSVYAVAHQINSVFLLFATGISSVFITRIHKIDVNDNDEYLKLTIKVGRIQFIILSLILTGFIFFGKRFIELWVGSQYFDSYVVALLLISPLVFITIKSTLTEVYRAKNKHIFRAIIYLLIAVCNAIISYFLCEWYGAIGAALGTTISLIIGNVIIMNVYDHRVVKINMIKFWKSILKLFPALILPIIVGVWIMIYLDISNLLIYLLAIVVYSVVYCLSFYFVGMNNDEKNLIKSFLKR